MRPPIHDNVKRVNVITSPRSGRLIDHNLEDLVDVPVELSLSLSPPSLSDSASRMVLMAPQVILPLPDLLT